MINPYKQSEGINNFFINRETGTRLFSPANKPEEIVKMCKPNMDWIFNKCMNKSSEYRQMLENNRKQYVMHDPLAMKFPELKKKLQENMRASYDEYPDYDVSIMNPVFNNCSVLYQENCRKFYESKSLQEQFQLD